VLSGQQVFGKVAQVPVPRVRSQVSSEARQALRHGPFRARPSLAWAENARRLLLNNGSGWRRSRLVLCLDDARSSALRRSSNRTHPLLLRDPSVPRQAGIAALRQSGIGKAQPKDFGGYPRIPSLHLRRSPNTSRTGTVLLRTKSFQNISKIIKSKHVVHVVRYMFGVVH
jgi:hypothetical protein